MDTPQLNVEFQFHKGTSKTGDEHVMHALQNNFNSIKVQVKLLAISVFFHVSSFQFHKGTSKTLRLLQLPPGHLYFNSIKVQVKRW